MNSKNITILFYLLFAAFLTAPCSVCQAAGKLIAGTAKINITPSKPKYPVHDSLYARSLILESGNTRIAFVSLDLGGYTNIPLSETLKRQFRLQEIYFCPQHTHSAERAPDEWLNKQIIAVMKQASENTFEAVVSGGYKYFPQLGFNRLVLRDDGRARESWIGDEHYRAVNPERIPHGPVDPAVGILKLEVTPGTEANGRFIFRMSVPPLTEDMEPTMVPI